MQEKTGQNLLFFGVLGERTNKWQYLTATDFNRRRFLREKIIKSSSICTERKQLFQNNNPNKFNGQQKIVMWAMTLVNYYI